MLGTKLQNEILPIDMKHFVWLQNIVNRLVCIFIIVKAVDVKYSMKEKDALF